MYTERVYSGETELIEDHVYENWFDGYLYDEEEEKEDYEEFLEHPSVQEFLKSLQIIPLYQYISNYLYYFFYGKRAARELSQEDLEELCKKVIEKYKENKMPSAKCQKKHIMEILTTEWSREWDNFENASTERIFELALGLNLPCKDVELLLQKAVKRAGFNYHDKDELLTYCVIRYQKTDKWECLKALQRDWKQIPEITDEEMIPVRNEQTEEIRYELDDIMRGESSYIYQSDKYTLDNLNPGLRFFISKQKASKIEKRTAVVIFKELYDDVIQAYKERLLEYKSEYRGSDSDTELEITYNPEKEVRIPAGTVFYAERRQRGGGGLEIKFATVKDETLPRIEEEIEVLVPIQSLEAHAVEKEKKAMPCYIKKEEKLTLHDSENIAGITSIVASTTVKYTGKLGEVVPAKGEIAVKAKPGTVIPEGTKFCYNDKAYQSMKEIVVKATYAVAVAYMDPSEPGETIADTNTIKHMKKPIDGILGVTNLKPVVKREATDTIPKEVVREFLYGHNADVMNRGENEAVYNLLGRWFTETEITSVRFSNMANHKVKNEVRRCDIITFVFLRYCKAIADDEFGKVVSEKELINIYLDFVDEVDGYLEECRMLPFYVANPYERLLAYLLRTDEPVDWLRNMWIIVNAGRR